MSFSGYYPTYPQMNYYQQGGAVPDALGQYKAPYQPLASQQYSSQNVQPSNDMIWVLGEVEATSYPVAPNNAVVLWDRDQPTIFIKSVNAQGVPSMRVLDYTERSPGSQKAAAEHICSCGKGFVKIEEFNEIKQRLFELSGEVEALSSKTKPKATKTAREEPLDA